MKFPGSPRDLSVRVVLLAFLKKEPEKASGRNRSPESEALRTNYMALRLKTFWWSFGMSAAGFLIAIISLVVALCLGKPHTDAGDGVPW